MKGCFFACLLFGCGCVCCSCSVNGANLVDAQIANLVDAQIKRLRDSTGLDSCAFVSDVRRCLCDIKGRNVEKRTKRLIDNVLSGVDALLDNGFDGGAIGELRLGDDDNVDAIFEWNDSGMSLFCNGECCMSNVDKYLRDVKSYVALYEKLVRSSNDGGDVCADLLPCEALISSFRDLLHVVCRLWELHDVWSRRKCYLKTRARGGHKEFADKDENNAELLFCDVLGVLRDVLKSMGS